MENLNHCVLVPQDNLIGNHQNSIASPIPRLIFVIVSYYESKIHIDDIYNYIGRCQLAVIAIDDLYAATLLLLAKNAINSLVISYRHVEWNNRDVIIWQLQLPIMMQRFIPLYAMSYTCNHVCRCNTLQLAILLLL